MSSIVDPVTGLPLVSGIDLGGIDQIPLDSQVFPYDDYGATARPNRGPSYPDDILPVSANVSGLYNKAAQAVGTDGKNALLVSVVNNSGGGGGGLGPQQYQHNTNTQSYTGVLANFTQQLDITTGATYLLGVDLSVAVDSGDWPDGTTDLHWWSYVTANANHNVVQMMLAKGSLGTIPSAPPGDFIMQWSKTIMFPVPVVVASTFGGDITLVYRATGWTSAVAGTLMWS